MRRPSRLRHPRAAVRRLQVLPRRVRALDAAAARRVNARGTHPAVDRGYARLSRAADRSVLWFSLAAALVVFGRGRAALRGSGSLLVASILANLVGKQLFGGNRPLVKDIPVGRRLAKAPTSPSFPSGHAASAAAFAAGVALESPRAGMALAPLAAAVAYSRLHTGAHWLSDVLGGGLLGAGVAVAGKLLVPVPPASDASTREGGTEIELPALPDGDGALIVVNRGSGASTIHADPVDRIVERLPAARLHILQEGEDLAETLERALHSDDPPRVLGVCGGDGTAATVAHIARQAGVPFLVIPGGTFNHFARAAGMETVDIAIDAVQAGEGVRADVAVLTVDDGDPITVLNAASIGLYPGFVAEREKHEKSLGKWLSGLIAAVRVLRASDPVDVDVNNRRLRVWSLYVGVNRNYPATIAPLQRRRLDDGVLDVRILTAGSRVSAVGSLAFGRRTSAVARSLLRLDSELEGFTAESVTVVVRPQEGQPPGFAHDGEVEFERTAPRSSRTSTLRIVPGALEVFSPWAVSRSE